MPNSEIFLLFPDDKDIATMQQPESLLVPSKPDSPHSSLFPDHQENQCRRQENHKQQDQGQEEEDQDNLHGRSRGKRKRECNDEASCVEIQETPRKLNSGCYYLPRPPRKPKATPAIKRRAMRVKRSVALLDVAREVESMFPPSILQDFGKKIKKARS